MDVYCIPWPKRCLSGVSPVVTCFSSFPWCALSKEVPMCSLFNPHFTAETAEAQQGVVSCLRPHSRCPVLPRGAPALNYSIPQRLRVWEILRTRDKNPKWGRGKRRWLRKEMGTLEEMRGRWRLPDKKTMKGCNRQRDWDRDRERDQDNSLCDIIISHHNGSYHSLSTYYAQARLRFIWFGSFTLSQSPPFTFKSFILKTHSSKRSSLKLFKLIFNLR